jgi:molybdenum cofactor cytidylyltransferase
MFRSFAVIPAAGRSERMGAAHKLLLPLAGRPLIDHILTAWAASCATRAVVVVRPDDAELAACCRRFPVDVVVPPAPPGDMKRSVQLALEHIQTTYAPADDDAVLLAPADMPRLRASIIDFVLHAYAETRAEAVVPTFNRQRGHPVVLRWSRAREIHALAPHEGVNALIARVAVQELPCQLPQIVEDVDTMEDFERHAAAWPRDPSDAGAGFIMERGHSKASF